MSKLWSTFSIIVGTIGFLYGMILFSSCEFMGGIACLISTFFSSAILYSIGEYFYRNDRMQEMLLLIYQELKNEKRKMTSSHEEDIKVSDPMTTMTVNPENLSMIKPIMNGKTITCPRCNTSQRLGRSVCWECGTKFETE